MRKLLVVLGVPIDNLTMDEALARCDEFIAVGRATGRTHQIATVNADFVVNSLHDPELQRILQEADMATADGMPLVWGSRLLGGRLPGRVTGADMVPALATHSAKKGYSIFFLGAREGVAAKAAAILQQRNPGLKVAGVLSPPPTSVLDMDRSVLETVKAAKPDILLVAFGNPKQEKWIRMHAHELAVPICIGIGGTLDMIVGVTKRAPAWMQKSGLEWIYRLAQEPRRLVKRYVHDFGYFGYFFARQWWGMRRGTAMSIVPSKPAEPAPAAAVTATPPATPIQPAEPAQPSAPVQLTQLEEPEQPEQPVAVSDSATPATPIIYLRGRLDSTNHTVFAEQANHMLDQNPYLIVNMAAAQFFDSSALGALIALANRAKAAGGAFWLVEVPQPIRSLLTLVRLENFFEIYADAPSAEAQRNKPKGPQAPQLASNGWAIARMPRMIDGDNTPALVERCLATLTETPYLVLDCSETVFMSSAGLAAMLKLDRAAREQKGALRIVNCSHDVERTIKLVKLDNILTLMPDVASAIKDTPTTRLASAPAR